MRPVQRQVDHLVTQRDRAPPSPYLIQGLATA